MHVWISDDHCKFDPLEVFPPEVQEEIKREHEQQKLKEAEALRRAKEHWRKHPESNPLRTKRLERRPRATYGAWKRP